MIVTCTACRTQFRISDDKVGPKGAKVRCSKCRAVFTIHREEELQLPPEARATPPPLPRRGASAGGPTPTSLAVDLSLELRAPPAARPDDPFAPRTSPAADPFAVAPPPPEPFAPAAAPPLPTPLPVSDPFLPPVSDPFAALPVPERAGPIPGQLGSAVTPMASDAGIALEEVERRTSSPSTPAGIDALSLADMRAADFRTPGPSGLEVDDRRAAAPPPAPTPPRPLPFQAAPPAPAPQREPTPAPAPPRPRPRRRAAAVLVNSLSLALLLALAGGLYLYAKGGRAALWAAVGRETREAPLSVRDLRSGLYETAGGQAVLFVRGSVLAPGGSAGPVRVRVELLEGGRPVGGTEGLAGAVPSPEEIWRLEGPVDADRLRQEVAARAARRLGPAEAAPFLLVVWGPPADLRALDMRVVAEPAPGG